MYDNNATVIQEASLDPSNPSVPAGYYRGLSGQLRKVGKRGAAKLPDPNNFAPLGNKTTLHPFGDEIIVKIDKYADEATCRACAGTGHSDSTCLECGGNRGHWYDAAGNRDNRATADRTALTFKPCDACRASQYSDPIPRSTGRIPCKPCKGLGQAVGDSSIAMSTAYEDEPTTGVVLAIGPACKRVARGDRILFSRFAGQQYEFEGRKYRIMKENYPMGYIKGKAEVRVTESAG